MIPLFIICRDRVAPLKKLIDHLETVEGFDIVLVDNASTYEPLLEYLRQSPHQVEYLSYNGGHHSPWTSGLVPHGTIYGVTDPDVVPLDTVPKDYPELMCDVLRRYPRLVKCGFSLRIDNIPDHYKFKKNVIRWEAKFWRGSLMFDNRVKLWRAPVDTTFALYNPNKSWDVAPAVRLDAPYIAEHLAWYVDSDNPSEEDLYYTAHADKTVATWLYDSMLY